ncbi:MAG TPA: hypothetical protein VFO05_08365 [Candidatus Limnocylindrales bacterium]|nr:hypothetical protein [Candidatus Limnocylindrales bacterium]
MTRAPDEVTEALDIVVHAVDDDVDPFVLEAGRRTLLRTEW